MEFKFDTEVPIPGVSGAGSLGPRSDLGCFMVDLMAQPIGASGIAPSGKAATISSSANYLGGKGWFTTRTTPEGVRVWKIAEPTKKRNG